MKKIVLNQNWLRADMCDLNQAQNIELGKAVKRIAEGNTKLEDIAPLFKGELLRWKPSREHRNCDDNMSIRCVYMETDTEIIVIAAGARNEDFVYKQASRRFAEYKASR